MLRLLGLIRSATLRESILAAVEGGPDGPGTELHVDVEEFRRRLLELVPMAAQLVLVAECPHGPDEIKALDSLLGKFRVVLIVDTSDRVLVRNAHLLRPRLVIDPSDAVNQIPLILKRLLRAQESKTEGNKKGNLACRH